MRTFALVMLDLGLTDTDPFALCRDASPRVPVMAIARQCSTESCIRALEAGADDCVRTTITGRELIARVRNLMQRAPEPPPSGQSLEDSVMAMRVCNGDRTFDLTRGESELLALLLRHAPVPLTIPRIAQLLESKRTTVESRIKSLRRKVGARLVARGGFGYAIEEPDGCRDSETRDRPRETGRR